MFDDEAISQKLVDEIEKHGCCRGKFRILQDDIYCCCLNGIYACKNQNMIFPDTLYDKMNLCETMKQHACENCEQYKKAGKPKSDGELHIHI